MIQPATPARSHAAPHPASPTRRGGGTASPAAFLDTLVPTEDEPSAKTTERQDDAEGGKPLPDSAGTVPLDWLATLQAPAAPPPAAPPPVSAAPGSTGAIPPTIEPASPTPASTPPSPTDIMGALPEAPTPQPPALGPSPFAAVRVGAFGKDPALAPVHGPVVVDLPAGTARRDLSAATTVTPPMTSVAAATTVVPGTTARAGEVFAAALHAVDRDTRKERTADDAGTLPTLHAATAIGGDLAPHAVTGAGDAAGGGALDMHDERWPHAMMDRIERLRDDANAADTRIRVVPDQLGSIDIAVRREGDTLHVRFHAAEAATRDLLADAQPRLAAIAEQRGMRLGDAAVGGGTGQQPRQAPRPDPVTFTQPASVSTAAIAATDPTDDRIA